MLKKRNSKIYDLEDRTYIFAKNCRIFTKKLPKSISNIEYVKQLIRASGSQAANYIEANEAISKKDFIFRIKICRKEAKESRLWLRLCEPSPDYEETQRKLIKESIELTKIFGAILEKSK